MISHVFIGVNRFAEAFAFYDAVLGRLGHRLRFRDDTRPWAGWQTPGVDRPLVLIGAPEDGRPAAPGNGQMVALLAPTRAALRAAYQAGLAASGRDDGAPGLRPHYHPGYYGAYLRDPDGNKLALACHAAEPPAPAEPPDLA